MSVNATAVSRFMKVAGALILLVCYALPMSSCTRDQHALTLSQASEDPAGTAPQTVVPKPPPIKEYYYLLPVRHPRNLENWLATLAFLVPAVVMLGAIHRPDSRATRAIWFAEPLVLGWVGLSLFVVTLFNTWEIGSYVAVGGLLMFAIGWLVEAFIRIRAGRLSWRILGLFWATSLLLSALGTAWTLRLTTAVGREKQAVIALGLVLMLYLFIILTLGFKRIATHKEMVSLDRSSDADARR